MKIKKQKQRNQKGQEALSVNTLKTETNMEKQENLPKDL